MFGIRKATEVWFTSDNVVHPDKATAEKHEQTLQRTKTRQDIKWAIEHVIASTRDSNYKRNFASPNHVFADDALFQDRLITMIADLIESRNSPNPVA